MIVTKYLILLLIGLSMPALAQEPEWVQTLFEQLGPETMSKPSNELTGDELFTIYHVTKNFNGADDGVFPMFEMYGDKVRPVLLSKCANKNTPSAEIATAKEIVNIFFDSDKELMKLCEI
jgi:hypothetical protein